MTQPSDNLPSPTPSKSPLLRLAGGLVRLLIPILILGGGAAGYYTFSGAPEEAKSPRARKQEIRSRVIELHSQDYSVLVTTQGIVRSHNEITLSGQVSGQITFLSPNFEAGSYFSKGEVLIEIDPRDYASVLRAAEARHLSATSALKLAQINHDRASQGIEGDTYSVITKAEVDLTAAGLTQAESNLNAATVQVDQAKLDLERTKIQAPFDGRVREKMVGLGQSLNQGTAAGVIFAIDYAEVRLPIAAREREFLRLPEMAGDDPLSVILRDAISTESTQTWSAQIVRTEGTLDIDSLELFAIARIDDPFGIRSGNPPLRIGQPVSGSISGHVLRDVVALPRVAVRQLDQIIVISKYEQTLTNVTIQPIWSDEEFIIVPGSVEYEDALLAMTHIVHAPDGARVEIIPDIAETEESVTNGSEMEI